MFTGASSPEFSAALNMAKFYDENGRVFLKDDKSTQAKFNMSVNRQRLADYVPYSVGSLHMETEGTVILDHILGVGFDQVTGRRDTRYPYEINYDLGSIGRKLDFDAWQESQAWQALSPYEAYRKKRWLDFDGMNWCPGRK